MFKENPYNWHKSSLKIKSVVVDFTLKDNAGRKVRVSETQEPIQLWLSLKDHSNKLTRELMYFVKPSVGAENIRYHRISIPSYDAVAMVEIRPATGQTVHVYVSANSKPTPENRNFSLTLPDYSSCQSHSPDVGYFNCTSNPYMFTLTSKRTGAIGPHFVGVRYVVSSTALSEKKSSVKSRVARDCGSYNGRQKRSCIGDKDPPTTPSPTGIVRPIYKASTDVNYTMSVKIASCKYWSEEMNKWTSEGCEVCQDIITRVWMRALCERKSYTPRSKMATLLV